MPALRAARRTHLLLDLSRRETAVSSPKANWFVDELPELLDGDPLEAPIEELGTRIDLRTEPDLLRRLAALVSAEARLDRDGVTCAIRDRHDSVCSACPVKGAAGELCGVGIELELVCSTIAVLQVQAHDQTS